MVKASSLAEFCFDSLKTKSKATHFGRQILLAGEKFIDAPKVNCSHIYLSEERFELMDAYLRKHFVVKNSTPSIGRNFQVKNNSSQCLIQLKEISKSSVTSQKIEIMKNGVIKKMTKTSAGNFSSSLLLQSGSPGSIETPSGSLKLNCRISTGKMATIDIEKPHGIKTRVILNNGQSTTIGMSSGNKKSKERSFDLIKGTKLNKASPQSQTIYSLSLKVL